MVNLEKSFAERRKALKAREIGGKETTNKLFNRYALSNQMR